NLSSISKTILEYPKEDIIINNNQSITCGSEFITIDALQEIVQQILLNAESKADNFYHGIINEIKKLKKPFLEKIMTWLIMPLLISFLTILFTPAINQLYDNHFDQRKVRLKQIKKEISNTEFNLNMLQGYRLVSCGKLDVRATSWRKSKLIGRIYFGQIVKVIERKKNWTLIEWKNSEEPFELILRGWVFNRYLEKLNRN
ncbi:MAG: SH3 domain-containing protein, partial [Desulfobaccales bacterium]